MLEMARVKQGIFPTELVSVDAGLRRTGRDAQACFHRHKAGWGCAAA
jgi:hypothetical protein